MTPEDRKRPCWLPIGNDDWRCRECGHVVNRGWYPTHFAHEQSCSYSAHPIIERAEQAEARVAELNSSYALLVAEHEKTEAELATMAAVYLRMEAAMRRVRHATDTLLRGPMRTMLLEMIDQDLPAETPAEWGCSQTTNNGDRCVLPAGHDGSHSL